MAVTLSSCGDLAVLHRATETGDGRGPLTISVLGTNDIHGHIEQLPLLAGYINNVRAARAADGGGVVLVDGGDIFQGTLESNIGEGDMMIEAFNAMGYSAAAIGNHEFDFGPVGDLPPSEASAGNPRGALEARASMADFPLLTANIRDLETGRRVDWANSPASTMIEVKGVQIGILGVTSMSTPRTVMPANFVGLEVTPLQDAILEGAESLRAKGAVVVVVAAHAGGRCEVFDDPRDLSSCDIQGEIFEVARALPAGAVDVIVAGHDHNGVAHLVGEVGVIESFKNGRAFGRVDLVVSDGRVVSKRVFPPRQVCLGSKLGEAPRPDCRGGVYEGAAVRPDPKVAAIYQRSLSRAQKMREKTLGVEMTAKFEAHYFEESPVGNLFTDLMLAAEPSSDVAITNGGGLRADLPAGALTFGSLYEASPFDNRFAFLTITAAQLADLISWNLGQSYGLLSVAGIRAVASCLKGEIHVELERSDGSRIEADETLRIVTSDFLASGGDGFPVAAFAEGSIEIPGGWTIRDAMAHVLQARGGSLRPEDFFDPQQPRMSYWARPMSCE